MTQASTGTLTGRSYRPPSYVDLPQPEPVYKCRASGKGGTAIHVEIAEKLWWIDTHHSSKLGQRMPRGFYCSVCVEPPNALARKLRPSLKEAISTHENVLRPMI